MSFENLSKGFFNGKIRKGEPRRAQRQDGFHEIANKLDVKDARPVGLVKYKNGELVQ